MSTSARPSSLPSAAPRPAVRRQALPAWAIGPFERPVGLGPVIGPDRNSVFHCPMRGGPVRWEALHAFNPAAVVMDNRVHLLYRAEDDYGDMRIGGHTSRLGLATSDDGLHFSREAEPVFYPDNDDQRSNEWDGGVEDARLVEAEDGRFVMTYTQWDRRAARLAVATSRDLRTWSKHGPAFARGDGDRWAATWVKAGSIVCKVDAGDGRLKATTIGGKYWMYWGEWGVRLAWSHDLIDWNVVTDAAGGARVVLGPRPGRFDAPLVESGPPAVLTDHGIVLMYNAKNDGDHDVPGLGAGAYAGGQALFAADEPTRLIGRLDTSFIQPALDWERSGQYGAGTTFIEGLVRFKGRWLLYYGCADSLVGVAAAAVTA